MTYNDIKILLSNKELSSQAKEKLQHMLNKSRCSKCVYEGPCRNFDQGNCKNYKRDPPDGGYYG